MRMRTLVIFALAWYGSLSVAANTSFCTDPINGIVTAPVVTANTRTVLSLIEDDLKSETMPAAATKFMLSFPSRVKHDPLGGERRCDFRLGRNSFALRYRANRDEPPNTEYYYTLEHPVSSAASTIRARLDALVQTGLYGLHSRARYYSGESELAKRFVAHDTVASFQFEPDDRRCKALTIETAALVIRMRSIPATERAKHPQDFDWRGFQHSADFFWPRRLVNGDKSICIPRELADVLELERPKELWAECTVRVDRAGRPIALPDAICRPVAVLTSHAILVAREHEQFWIVAGGFATRFNNAVLDFSKATDPSGIARRVIPAFREELVRAFGRAPIRAKLDATEPLHSGELLVRRDYEWSYVLASTVQAKVFERSAYLLSLYCPSSEFSSLGDALGSLGGDSCRQLFLKVSASVQISSRKNGDYPDPTAAQDAKYRAAVEAAVLDAIGRTAQRFGGQFINGRAEIGNLRR